MSVSDSRSFLSVFLAMAVIWMSSCERPSDSGAVPAPVVAKEEARAEEPAAVKAVAPAGNQAAIEAAAATEGGKPAAAAAPAASGSRSWPMWGGTPERNMVNLVEKNIPQDWDLKTGKNIKWTAKLGSQAYGNPVIGSGRILVGTNNELERNPKIKGDKGVVMCFAEADGKFLWQAVHDKLPAGRVNDWPNQGICSTPAIDGNRCYYVSNRAEVVCADLDGFTDGENDGPYTSEKYTDPIDGDFIWVFDMMEELTVFPHNLATSSPLVVGDVVYLITSNGVDESHIVIPSPNAPSFIAIDKNTGKVIWENTAPGDAILHGQWSSPSYGMIGGSPQAIFAGGNGWLYGLDPKSGEEIWKFDGNPKDAHWELYGRGTRNNIISTPVIHDGRVYFAMGQDPEHGEGIGHLYCIQPAGKKGDITQSGLVWHRGGSDFKRTIASVAVKDGLVYAVDLSGFLQCLDAETGKPYWIHDTLAAVWGSPTVIDGKVFLGDEDGDVVILKEGKELQKLAEHNMGNSVYSTAVAVGGVLYISNRTTLIAIQASK